MATKTLKLPLVVITGPTASGKTALAVELAAQYNGEIICADSRTVYKGMDIGTAKPTSIEQQAVPHWGLDLVEPDDYFSVADFKKYADKKILEITSRNHIPFLVGGTGLYIDAVLFDYQFGLLLDKKLRLELQHMSLEELHDYSKTNQINLPENDKNKRYVIRAIENKDSPVSRSKTPVYKNIIVGITTDKNVLQDRIKKRTEQLLENGVVDEAKMLGEKYGWENEAMKSNIYPIVHKYLQNEITLDELKQLSATADWHLAKRQLTWLRRNPLVQWKSLFDAKNYLVSELAKYK